MLAIAGSLARKKHVPAGAGTLPTHTPLFVVLLVGTSCIVGALTFVPALALGPIVEHLHDATRLIDCDFEHPIMTSRFMTTQSKLVRCSIRRSCGGR